MKCKYCINESCGRFLLAKFHMNALEEQTTAREIIDTLERLPSNIKEIYDNVFRRIGNLRWAKKLKKLITIVATARKLLSTEALAHAIVVNPGDDDIDPYDLSNIQHLSSMCAGLIDIDHSGFVRLAHETVGFYIAQNGLETWSDGHGMMADICLVYLQFKTFSSGACMGSDHKDLIDERRHEYPFLTYAATNWGHHARETTNPQTAQLTNDFLGKQAHIAAAAQIMWIDDMETSSGWDAEDGVHGLHVASYFGLSDAVSVLLSSGIDADVEDCLQTTPLMYAAQEGHTDIVRTLLRAGANPGRICGRNRTVLHRVCLKNTSQHINIVKQIVSSTKDISINAFDVNYGGGTALMHAVFTECEESVKLLLTRKDIDVGLQKPNKPRNNALLIAVIYGCHELVETLLDDGRVSIESMNLSGQTALNLAASKGYLSIVELLLGRGANIDTGDMYEGPPLLRAIDNNRLECVRLLIERGVNYRFKDSLGRGALHACAINKRGVIMRYLLKNLDLDPNVQGNGGETPLHDAVGANSVAITKILLEYGARTDIEDKMGRTPLVRARDLQRDRLFSILKKARKKEPKVMKDEDTDPLTIPKHPARADTLSEEYKLPIHSVVRHYSRKELEKYLSDLGPQADEAINQTDSVDLKTPLHFAARFGRVDSMRLLLERGASVGPKDRWGYTPLHIAVDFGQLEAIEFLLQNGCEVNEKDLLGRTPLMFAIDHQVARANCAFLLLRHNATFQNPEGGLLLPLLSYAIDCNEIDIVKILIEGGVPFRIRDQNLLTPYQRAKRAGHQAIAQYIYDRAVGDKSYRASNESIDTIHGQLEAADAQGTSIPNFNMEKGKSGGEPADTSKLEGVIIKRNNPAVSDGQLSILGLTTRECGLVVTIIILISILLYR